MKQKIYILGVTAAMIISTGVIFKVNHWPAAGIMITAGTLILVLLFFPAALISNYKAEGNSQNRLLYIVTYITCLVVFTGMLFKIMHWPYAGIGLMIALPFPYIVFLPVFLMVTAKNRNFNIYNTIFVLLLLALNSVFSSLLALNVSKNSIDDSYNISHNYTRVSDASAQLPLIGNPSAVSLKIDEIIKITNEYRDLILKHEGMTREQWKKDPGNLLRPDNINTAISILFDNGEMHPGMKLDKATTELIGMMKQTKGYEDVAKALPSILDLDVEKGQDDAVNLYYRHIFAPLSWALIYLDGVETNLLMLKISLSAMNQ
jgi:hypothetical protein